MNKTKFRGVYNNILKYLVIIRIHKGRHVGPNFRGRVVYFDFSSLMWGHLLLDSYVQLECNTSILHRVTYVTARSQSADPRVRIAIDRLVRRSRASAN